MLTITSGVELSPTLMVCVIFLLTYYGQQRFYANRDGERMCSANQFSVRTQAAEPHGVRKQYAHLTAYGSLPQNGEQGEVAL